MSNELVIPDMPAGKYADEKTHALMATSMGFLPRLTLVASGSNLEKKKVASSGDYVLLQGSDKILHDFGGQVYLRILDWRPKAMQFKPKPKGFYNPHSPKFKEIEKLAESKIPAEKKGNVYGPEYLVYIPAADAIAVMHFNNTSMRMVAGGMKNNLGKNILLESELIEKPDYSWFAPVISPYSTPLDFPDGTQERVQQEMTKFRNPPEEQDQPEEAEKAPEGVEERPR